MVIELDEIVKLLGFAIAIPLTVCGIIAVVYLTVKTAQFTIYFLGKVNNAVNKTVDDDPDFNKLKF